MHCWGELKILKAQSVGEVIRQCILVTHAFLSICGNESQPGLQLLEKLITSLLYNYGPSRFDQIFQSCFKR